MWIDFRKRSLGVSRGRQWSAYALLLMLPLLWWQCQEDKTALIAQKVQERVSEFREKKKQECRLALLQKAEKTVDSLLLAEARQALQDSLGRMRPFRPTQPPDVPAIDSSGIAPLFKDSGGNQQR